MHIDICSTGLHILNSFHFRFRNTFSAPNYSVPAAMPGSSSAFSAGSSSDCKDPQLMHLLKTHFSSNDTVWQLALDGQRSSSCPLLANVSSDGLLHSKDVPAADDQGTDEYTLLGELLYAFVTPFILVVGLVGNFVSLKVFSFPQLRKLSASMYLTAISVSDSLVLVTFVLLDWLNRGLPLWPGSHRVQVINTHGVCQSFLFASYTFRFVSVWLIVLFTIERYIAVCRPFHRRLICTKTFARRAIASVVVLAAVISLYKPLLSGVYTTTTAVSDTIQQQQQHLPSTSSSTTIEPSDHSGRLTLPVPTTPDSNRSSPTSGSDFGVWGTRSAGDILMTYPAEDATGEPACRRNPDYDDSYVNFVMDVTYGLLITAVPFVPICVFNVSILWTMLRRDTRIRHLKILVPEKKVRLEFTINLFAVSGGFVVLNMPYFIVWCQQFVQTLYPADDPSVAIWNRDKLLLAKVTFYVNYAINFFLYSLTGGYYRTALVRLFSCAEVKQRNFRMRHVSVSTTVTQFSSVKRLRIGTNV